MSVADVLADLIRLDVDHYQELRLDSPDGTRWYTTATQDREIWHVEAATRFEALTTLIQQLGWPLDD